MNPDPMDILGIPSSMPVPADPLNVTAAKQDSNVSISIMIAHSHSPRCMENRLDALRMKDSADTTDYVGQHTVLWERLHDSGTALRDSDTIYSLLIRLPHMPIWQQFKSMLEQRMHNEVMTATPGTPSLFTAIHSRPGSEYANAASSNSTNSTINLITGLCKHRHNPDGVFCTMPGCNKGNDDHAHCYGKGGGMEGQAPWMRNKKTSAVAAAATTSAPVAAPMPAPTPAIAATVTGLSSLMSDMSFASISEVPDNVSCLTALPFTTILDS
ncbi:uncharacterized protein EDB93DRAFT_1251295 [Suillus bovinus]|uniref:uncharacterized protein n=1 Tax=Suillus bovinus TaxID=48563 RepID=UPI001B8768BD|nr:uncharacterized protein EDB93DRAFT_1251295 [Suillus bovinus]KAG2145427.1 hypothetical protein EDB93DRAFT_1251295 [Suillus bovinus]